MDMFPQWSLPPLATPPILTDNPYSYLPPAEAAEKLGAAYLSNLPQNRVKWLWPGRIPIGSITLLAGDPGLGKSLVALDIAARLTSGAPWPDVACSPQSETSEPHSPALPASALLLTAEDDLFHTVQPRFAALGGDATKFLVLPAFGWDLKSENVTERPIDLQNDFTRIRYLLEATPACRLIIVDPINAFVNGGNLQWLLKSLAEIARKQRLAVLAINHLRKKAGAAIYRAMGGLAYVSAARAVWLISKDPDDPRRRLMLPIKNNLAEARTGLAYTVEESAAHAAPVVCWSPQPMDVSADAVLAPSSTDGMLRDEERRHAMQWLAERLAGGPSPSRHVMADAAANAIAPRTLRRAFREMGGRAVRVGSAMPTYWTWELLQQDGQPAR
jgi:putative DNA primase/helicase